MQAILDNQKTTNACLEKLITITIMGQISQSAIMGPGGQHTGVGAAAAPVTPQSLGHQNYQPDAGTNHGYQKRHGGGGVIGPCYFCGMDGHFKRDCRQRLCSQQQGNPEFRGSGPPTRNFQASGVYPAHTAAMFEVPPALPTASASFFQGTPLSN